MFFYNQNEYTGDVVEIGDDDQYDTLVLKLGQLNAHNKKARSSFHEDRPRKTRGKGKFEEALEALKSKKHKVTDSSKACSSQQLTKKVPSKKPLAQLLDACTSDDADSDVETSPGSSPIPENCSAEVQEEIKKVNRMSAVQGKASDVKLLRRTAKAVEDHCANGIPKSSCSSSVAEIRSVEEESVPVIVESGPSSTRVIPRFQDSDEETSIVDKALSKTRNKKQKTNHGTEQSQDRNNNEEPSVPSTKDIPSMLRWTQEDSDVTEICGRSKMLSDKHFYISNKDLKMAKMASNASIFAKSLLVAAFTDEALLKCTLSGGQYRAGGRSNITQKPALDADAVAVIIETAICRQTNKKWKPELSKKEIQNALRQKLVDIRPRLKAAAEVREDH